MLHRGEHGGVFETSLSLASSGVARLCSSLALTASIRLRRCSRSASPSSCSGNESRATAGASFPSATQSPAGAFSHAPVRRRVVAYLWHLATGEPLREISRHFSLGISTCSRYATPLPQC